MSVGTGELKTQVKTCRDCQQIYHLSAGEQQWYKDQKWTLPTRCKACRDARQRERDVQSAKYREPDDGKIEYRFDPEMMDYLQHDLFTLEEISEELQNRPSSELVTFKDLDKIFSIVQETITAARFLKLIPEKPETVVEETAQEEEAEIEEPLESSPQATRAAEEAEEEEEVSPPPAALIERSAQAGA